MEAAAGAPDTRGERASDDRSCAERGQDALGEVVGYVQRRLAHYRAAGELAVTFGLPVLQRKLARVIAGSLGQPAPAPPEPSADQPKWPQPETKPDGAGARTPDAAPLPERPRRRASASTNGARAAAEANSNGAGDLAIPSYDTLSASQVVERLAGLPAGDLDDLRGYEAAHRNRRTILAKIDQLRSSA